VTSFTPFLREGGPSAETSGRLLGFLSVEGGKMAKLDDKSSKESHRHKEQGVGPSGKGRGEGWRKKTIFVAKTNPDYCNGKSCSTVIESAGGSA